MTMRVSSFALPGDEIAKIAKTQKTAAVLKSDKAILSV
jgi:hypothetical protein